MYSNVPLQYLFRCSERLVLWYFLFEQILLCKYIYIYINGLGSRQCLCKPSLFDVYQEM